MVVYRPFPTSNHNERAVSRQSERVVYRPFPTSNHNRCYRNISSPAVVYRPFPTSNHNGYIEIVPINELYIVRFLHQTTTFSPIGDAGRRCISSVSYIKPQQDVAPGREPDSCISSVSYIKPQPLAILAAAYPGCISSVSYIKPQLRGANMLGTQCCISSVSYIKPQPIISNKLYTNILLIFFIIKNGRVGFVSIAKILKKLQLNRFADDFFCDFA